jgi:hypothetical protein
MWHAGERREMHTILGLKNLKRRSWRKLYNDEFHNQYSSPNIVKVIKARRLRWTDHVAHMGEGRDVYSFLVGRPGVKRQLGRPGVGGWIILSWTLGR